MTRFILLMVGFATYGFIVATFAGVLADPTVVPSWIGSLIGGGLVLASILLAAGFTYNDR